MRTRGRRQMSGIQQFLGVAGSLVAIAVVWALVSLLSPDQPITGRATAVDGDTLRIGDARIRLTGLDAPELDQVCTNAERVDWPCGWEARAFLSKLAGDATTSCTPSGRDRYGRVLARCQAGGDDLGAAIVAGGWAVSSDLGYAAAEREARRSGRGIWAGTFQSPADWRRDHGEPALGLWEWLRSWFG